MTRSGAGLFAALALTLAATPTPAQPPAPPPPARYNAVLRYHITSARDQHVRHYDALVDFLKQQGFAFVPALDTFPDSDREDRTKTTFSGTIGSANFLRLFRNTHVAALLLTPPGYTLPAAPDQPVAVRLELAPGFTPRRQQDLARQARVLLRQLGFVEAAGYDDRGYTRRPHTRLVGTVPAAQLQVAKDDPYPLPPLLKDLRSQPGGWLGPRILLEDLPAPLAQVSPLLVIEVLPDAAPPKGLAASAPRDDFALTRISDDLWAIASRKEDDSRVVRMEVLLAYTPDEKERGWREALAVAAPSVYVEGRIGSIVTVQARARDARGLAALPLVSTVRLARPARVGIDPAVKIDGDNARALRQSGLERLHRRGARGQGVRLVVIDADFQGHEELMDGKHLPKVTKYIDLTAERNDDLLPDPPAGDPKFLGHGTRCALAAALAAPDADLTLVRIDPAAPHQLLEVAKFINGAGVSTEYLTQRQDELSAEAATLRQRLRELLDEREKVLRNFEDEKNFETDYGILGTAGVWLFSERQWHYLRMEELERDERDHRRREVRYLRLIRALQDLRGAQVVSCALVWNTGYPLSATSPLSRWFDDNPSLKFLWFQSAGNTAGQNWNGLFRDADDNGVMEFAAPDAPLPRGRWTRELNFLGWRPWAGKESADLPAGARVRLALQWREPHDPDFFFRPGEWDVYRQPLASLRLVVLHQRDPGAKVLPADAFEVVARSEPLPQRLDNQPTSSTYELLLEFPVDKAGRYAVRVERQRSSQWELLVDPRNGREAVGLVDGLTPTGIRPLGTNTLPALEKQWELRTRLFVETVDEASVRQGRPVFLDFATARGTLGVPGDARAVVSVGAAGLDDKRRPYSADGAAANLDYLVKPDVLAYDALRLGKEETGVAFGASLATPFAAGLAACLRSDGMRPADLWRYLHQRPGGVLRAPAGK